MCVVCCVSGRDLDYIDGLLVEAVAWRFACQEALLLLVNRSGEMGNNSGDGLLVREQKGGLVEVVVGQGDGQQQYYL